MQCRWLLSRNPELPISRDIILSAFGIAEVPDRLFSLVRVRSDVARSVVAAPMRISVTVSAIVSSSNEKPCSNFALLGIHSGVRFTIGARTLCG